jgi:hypothetical protein
MTEFGTRVFVVFKRNEINDGSQRETEETFMGKGHQSKALAFLKTETESAVESKETVVSHFFQPVWVSE